MISLAEVDVLNTHAAHTLATWYDQGAYISKYYCRRDIAPSDSLC
jgi:hypothetical protein